MDSTLLVPSYLPVIFYVLLGVAMLVYVVLDGFDLGVGLLVPLANEEEKDRMLASIGPFWDANETWLVLGIGLLLIAFPKANGIILGHLYLAITLMLIGLIIRGVAFDFRAKVHADNKMFWNRAFFCGSLLAGTAQGWMLGRYITGFQTGYIYDAFAGLIALTLPATYIMLGATWLIIKTENELQRRAVGWAKKAWPLLVSGVCAISIATPLVSASVAQRWFRLPEFIALLPIPITTALALISARVLLNSTRVYNKLSLLPFALIVLSLLLSFMGLAYSLYPFIVVDSMTLWQGASSDEALQAILIGVVITLPVIVAYTIFSYRVFWGKATDLHYG